jgi:hypothetical protein
MNTRNRILDIAMNLNRIGNWAADGYDVKKERIKVFLDNTSEYIDKFDRVGLNALFGKTYDRFIGEYPNLRAEGLKGPKNPLDWAEKMMTWGNILTHRSNLL